MPIYMRIEGPDIKGDVTKPGFRDTFTIASLSWGMARPEVASGGHYVGGRLSFSQLTVTFLSANTPKIWLNLANGTLFDRITLLLTQNQAGRETTYEQIILNNAIFTFFNESSGGDRPTVELGMVFGKIDHSYLNASEATWDLFGG